MNGDITGNNGGCLCGARLGRLVTTPSTDQYLLYVEHCSHTGSITGLSAGGLIGASACAEGIGKAYVRNCNHVGSIQGDSAGGIFAKDCFSKMLGSDSDVIVERCSSEGNVTTNTYSSGIFGKYCFSDYRPTSNGEQQYAIVRDCVHKGNLV